MSKIKLKNTQTGACVELDLAHAQRLLRKLAEQGREYLIIESSKYQFKDNVISRKRNKKSNSKATEQKQDQPDDDVSITVESDE